MMFRLILAIAAAAAGIGFGMSLTYAELAGDTLSSPIRGKAIDPVTSSAGAAKATVIGGTEYDFGVMAVGAKGSHAFKIRNDGQGTLQLGLQGTSCKCTVGAIQSDRLEPGQTGDISLEWSATSPAVEFRQEARIGTNDPNVPKIVLVVHGQLAQRLDPQEFVANDLAASSTRQFHAALYAYHGEQIEAKFTGTTQPELAKFFKVSLAPLTEEQRKLRPRASGGVGITVEVLPGLPLGPFEVFLKFESNLSDAPSIELPISGRVVGDIQFRGGENYYASKQILNLGIVKAATGAKQTLFVVVKGEHRDQTRIKVVSASPATSLKATLGEAIETERTVSYPLLIEVPANSPTGNHLGGAETPAGTILLSTTHPEFKEIALKVGFLVE